MLPMLLYVGLVFGMVGGMLATSAVLGERHRGPATDDPYESGIRPTGSARLRFSAQFYLVGVFFVVFDVEAVFLYTWAVAVRELGWAGFGAVALFSAILLVALAYLWRNGALDWRRPAPTAESRRRARESVPS